MIAYIDSNPQFTLKLASGRDPQREIDAYGSCTYTVFVSGYPYSLASVRFQKERGDERHPTGSWTVYCMSRRDIGLDLVETSTFANREDMLAFIREQYVAALRVYETRATEVLDFIRADLSNIEKFDSRCSDDQEIIMGVIYKDPTDWLGQRYFEVVMSLQEALTFLDRGSVEFAHGTVVGRVTETVDPGYKRFRFGFAEWRVPQGWSDYTLCGWKSTTGLARSKWERKAA